MKRYTILGIVVAAVAIMLLSFIPNQESNAADMLAFSGSVDSTRNAVVAMGSDTTYFGTIGPGNWYKIYIPSDDPGWYTVTDGCQHATRYFNGQTGQFVHFCVPQTCPCSK